MVEQLTCNQQVIGSIPIAGSISFESNPCVKNYTLVRLYVINQTVSKLNDHETHLNQTKMVDLCALWLFTCAKHLHSISY